VAFEPVESSASPRPPAVDRSRTFGGRALAYLRAHPILCLAILTPGIPEYLSTSSPVLNLALNPFWFFLGLAINVGQYTAGALLIREALIRWKKGWGAVVPLGLAYGITEEGLGDNTLFNSNGGRDQFLGWFGRFDGVNWVWSTGVLAFHVIYSIGLPILLLGLALPSTRGRSLVGRRGVVVAFVTLSLSTALESAIVWGSSHYWMGPYLLLGCVVSIVLLVFVGYRFPDTLIRTSAGRPTWSPTLAAIAGFCVFPVLFLLEYLVPSFGVPPAGIIALELAFLAVLGRAVVRGINGAPNEYLLVNLAFGFVLWQAVFGILLTLGVPYTLPLIVVALWFFLRLGRGYARRGSDFVPPGATLG
jgi:hypothetical protein